MYVYELNISAQTEGDTGYDYNDAYEEEYEDESCKYYINITKFRIVNDVMHLLLQLLITILRCTVNLDKRYSKQ